MLKLLNFDIIIEQASGRYNALSETKQKELKESLSNGKTLLKSSYQLDAYLHHYGDMHRKKLLRAYSHRRVHFPAAILGYRLGVWTRYRIYGA